MCWVWCALSGVQLTDRTRADVQGGILTEYEGKPKLVEAVQVPPEHLHEFHLLKKFNLFNTNNLWVSLRAVQVSAFVIAVGVWERGEVAGQAVSTRQSLFVSCPLLVPTPSPTHPTPDHNCNHHFTCVLRQRLIASNAIRSAVIVNTRVEAGRKMLQLETAAGAAIEVWRRLFTFLHPCCLFIFHWPQHSLLQRPMGPCLIPKTQLSFPPRPRPHPRLHPHPQSPSSLPHPGLPVLWVGCGPTGASVPVSASQAHV
jgi:hypothetical protein